MAADPAALLASAVALAVVVVLQWLYIWRHLRKRRRDGTGGGKEQQVAPEPARGADDDSPTTGPQARGWQAAALGRQRRNAMKVLDMLKHIEVFENERLAEMNDRDSRKLRRGNLALPLVVSAWKGFTDKRIKAFDEACHSPPLLRAVAAPASCECEPQRCDVGSIPRGICVVCGKRLTCVWDGMVVGRPVTWRRSSSPRAAGHCRSCCILVRAAVHA